MLHKYKLIVGIITANQLNIKINSNLSTKGSSMILVISSVGHLLLTNWPILKYVKLTNATEVNKIVVKISAILAHFFEL